MPADSGIGISKICIMIKNKYEQISQEIQDHIMAGRFKNGQKLDSIRELSKKYAVSIATIQNAYEDLIIKGYVRSVPKSGNYVNYNPENQNDNPKIFNVIPAVRDEYFVSNLAATTPYAPKRTDVSEFNVAAPTDLIISQKLILRTMQQVIREKGASLLRYYPSNGSQDLRSHIASRAANHNTILNTQELIITDGALQALYIALASVTSPGDFVAVESPSVFSVLQLIRTLNLSIIEIPVDPVNGLDISFLRKACEINRISATIVTPNFHNPTGVSLKDDQKRALLALAISKEMVLIENDIYGDLHFEGTRPGTIKSLDHSGIVLTYSSFSKTLAGGIRLGWLSAGKFTSKAEQIKFSLGSTVSPIYQETVNKLLATTSYERHLRAFRSKLSKQCDHSLKLLSQHFPKETVFTRPCGGYAIWVELDEKINMDLFYNHCKQNGIRFTPGDSFSSDGAFKHCFRLIFADLYSKQKQQALVLAGKHLRLQTHALS